MNPWLPPGYWLYFEGGLWHLIGPDDSPVLWFETRDDVEGIERAAWSNYRANNPPPYDSRYYDIPGEGNMP